MLTDRHGVAKSTLQNMLIEPLSPQNAVRDRARHSNAFNAKRYEAGPLKEYNLDFVFAENSNLANPVTSHRNSPQRMTKCDSKLKLPKVESNHQTPILLQTSVESLVNSVSSSQNSQERKLAYWSPMHSDLANSFESLPHSPKASNNYRGVKAIPNRQQQVHESAA